MPASGAVSGYGAVLSVSTPDQLRTEIRDESALWEAGLKDVSASSQAAALRRSRTPSW